MGSTIAAGNNLTITAGQDVKAKAADLSAQGALSIAAKGNILLDAGQTRSSYDTVMTRSSSGFLSSTTTRTQTQSSSATAQASTLQGQSISVIADQNLVSVGTVLEGTDSVYVEGKDATALYATTNTAQSSTSTHSSSSFLGINLEDKTSTDSKAQSTSIGTRLVSTQKVEIGIGNKAELQGADIEAPQIAFTKTDPSKAGELVLGGSINTTQTSHTEKNETLGVYQESKGAGSTTQTLNQTTLKGTVSFDAGLKISIQIPKDVQATAGGQALAAQVQTLQQTLGSNSTGLAYLNQLAANPNVQWDKVTLANEHWSYEQAGLTPAGAALLSIAVAASTGGMGVEALGGTGSTLAGTALTTTTAAGAVTTTALGTAVNAGFASLASQTAVAMVNNQGDIGKTLAQLGSEQSVKGLLTTMVTAGALQSLDKALGFTETTPTLTGQGGAGSLVNSTSGIASSQAANQFAQNLLKNVTNNVAGAAIDSAINGKPFDEKALSSALSSALITAGMAKGANSIGAAGKTSDINALASNVAHAILGCAAGVASSANGSGCSAGAVGAVVGEAVANYALNQGMSDASTIALAQTLSAVTGVLVGGGGDNVAAVNIAAAAGTNAAENNATLHKSQQQVLAQLQKSQTPTQQQALADAACYLQRCAVGLDPNDPNNAAKIMSAYRGQSLAGQQTELKNAGFAPYSPWDALSDAGNVAVNAVKSGAKAVGGIVVDQAASFANGAKNLGNTIANDYANTVNQGANPQFPPGDLPSGGSGPTTPTAGAVVTPAVVCLPPVGCVPVPVIAPVVVPSGLTYSQGSDDGSQTSSPNVADGNPKSAQTSASTAGANGGVITPGKLIGTTEGLTTAEQSFIDEMVFGGKTVQVIPAKNTGRTADFFIDGTKVELKTMTNVINQTPDGLSKSLSSTIMNARAQSGNIIIDTRGQAGMTAEIAERGIARAFGNDSQTGSKIQAVTVITPQGTVYISRKPL